MLHIVHENDERTYAACEQAYVASDKSRVYLDLFFGDRH